ncbi:DnaJ family domain-containing protein [Klebsiella pneumoniae]
MWLLDQWAERHILDAQTKGEFDNLPGSGEPLTLDDDSHVPAELRAGGCWISGRNVISSMPKPKVSSIIYPAAENR